MYKENKLQFDVELGGNTYRVEGTHKENKIDGKWYPTAGGEGGSWSATRKSATPAPQGTPTQAVSPLSVIEGAWSTIAVTPDGNLTLQTVFKLVGGTLTGQLVTPDGTVPVQKLSFSENKLSFEVDYMGGTYRIEGILADGKMTGRWSAVGGSESGAWSAERKP
jgi:hypothetical protein